MANVDSVFERMTTACNVTFDLLATHPLHAKRYEIIYPLRFTSLGQTKKQRVLPAIHNNALIQCYDA